MTGKLILPAFILMVIAQWGIPLRMIMQLENVIDSGREFLFRTAPVDPNDPFRGKYIILSYLDNSIVMTDSAEWNQGEQVFVRLTTDTAGFASVQSLSRSEPTETDDFVKARISYIVRDSVNTFYLEYPFDRMYMEEFKAPLAEAVYNEASRDPEQLTWAIVMVDRGKAVVRDVMIDGVSIGDMAQKTTVVPE